MTIHFREPIFAVMMVAACALSAPAEEAKPIVLQIEDFKLTAAKVEPMKEAGGGKVVVMTDKKSRAETTIRLRGGWYEATLYVWADGEGSDCTHLWIEAEDYDAGVAELPVVPWEKKKIAPCVPMKFAVGGADRPRKIALRTGDPGVKLDRLEIKRLR